MNIWSEIKQWLGLIPVPVDVEPPFHPPAAAPAPTNPNGANWEDAFNPPPPPAPDVLTASNPNGPNWLSNLAPTTAPPTAPQTAPVAPPPTPTGTPDVQTYEAIQGYNNGLSMFQAASVWSEPTKGVVIHKIDQDQSEAISARVKVSAPACDLPVTYTLACLAIESTLDPSCENGNLGPGESNTANDPGGYDMGIAQLKLKYLGNDYDPTTGAFGQVVEAGVSNVTEAKAFAFDVDQAIPYHCSLMAAHVYWAQNTIEQNTSTAVDPRMLNPLMLATAAYNFGDTGVMAYFENGTFPSHCQQVLDLERYFAGKLGLASCFPPVSTAWPAAS